MKKKITFLLTAFFITSSLFAQQRLVLYSDAQKMVTGTWSDGDLNELSNGEGNDGEWVYQFDYSYNNWWTGFGLNIDNWGQSSPVDLSPYDSLRIGFWSDSEDSDILLQFLDSEEYHNSNNAHMGNSVLIDVTSYGTYIEEVIPLSNFVANDFDFSIISELAISMQPDAITGTSTDEGMLRIDYIILTGPSVGIGPEVSFVNPIGDFSVSTLEAIPIDVLADDPDGNVSKIHIYINDQLFYSTDSDLLEFDFIPWSNGDYKLQAIAIDNDGNTGFSSHINIDISNANENLTLGQERALTLGKGINLSGWMEALWHILFETGESYTEAGAYTKEELQFFKSMGVSTIRFPVILEWFDSDHPNYDDLDADQAFEVVDSVFKWTEELDLNLILVNHHGIEVTNDNWMTLKDYTIGVWNDIINRYGDSSTDRVLFELKNEPTLISSYNLRQYQQAIIAGIREDGNDRTLIIGGTGFNSGDNLYRWQPYNDKNLIYTYHNYQPFCFVNQLWDPDLTDDEGPLCPEAVTFPQDPNNPVEVEGLEWLHGKVADWRDQYSSPIFCGEFGVNTFADLDSRCNYFEAMGDILNSLEIPWTYWDPRSSDEMGEASGYGWFSEGIIDCNHLVDSCVYIGLGLEWNCDVVSNEPIEIIDNIEITPNPAIDILTIKGWQSENTIKYTVINDIGATVERGIISNKTIVVSKLNPGFYILKLEDGTKFKELKFIKL